MRLPVPAIVAASLLALAASPALPSAAAANPAASSPSQTPPPEIIRVYARPACAELQKHVLPVVAMVLQNDQSIAKSGPIFKQYLQTAMQSSSQSAYDTTNYDSPGRTMALQRMEKLVPTLAQNEIAIQTILEDSSLAQPTGNAEDDAQLQKLRADLLKTLAAQRLSLDLINGFVTTQQLGDIQHGGQEYVDMITGEGTNNSLTGLTSTPHPGATVNPAIQDPNAPGLKPNPYDIQPGQVPGIAVGYNPVSAVAAALGWVQEETARREAPVAQTMSAIASTCRAGATPQPPTTP